MFRTYLYIRINPCTGYRNSTMILETIIILNKQLDTLHRYGVSSDYNWNMLLELIDTNTFNIILMFNRFPTANSF